MISLPDRLKESFDNYAYDYLTGWEHDPRMEIINNCITGRDPELEAHEREMVELFERLRDSVDAIPATVIADVETRRSMLGNEKFEAVFKPTVEAVGVNSFPKNATDFIGTLMLNLQFATSLPSEFGSPKFGS